MKFNPLSLSHPDSTARNRLLDAANRGIALLFLVWAARFIFSSSVMTERGRMWCLFDDAMISMRYAWNLAHGHGLVWNLGERVEGYTNPLQVLIMALPALFLSKSNAVFIVQLLGVGWIFGIAGLVASVARSFGYGRSSALGLALMATLAFYPLLFWSLLGMETPLVGFAFTLGVASAIALRRQNSTSAAIWLTISGAMLYFSRPDAVLLFLPVLFYLGPARWRVAAGSLAVVTALMAAHFLWRHSFYGEWLPNTYVLKATGMPLANRLRNGWTFVLLFFSESGLLMALTLASCFFSPRREKWLIFASMLLLLAYQCEVGGDAWPYWRLMSPLMPLLILSLLDGVIQSAKTSRKRLQNGLFAALSAWSLWLANGPFWEQQSLQKPPYTASNNAKNVRRALLLERVLPAPRSIGLFWAGSIPYYLSDCTAADFLGKCDAHIARVAPDISGTVSSYGMQSVPGHIKYDLNYSIRKYHPQWIEGSSYASQKALEPELIARYRGVAIDGTTYLLRRDIAASWLRTSRAVRAPGTRPPAELLTTR